jgi:cell division protein FtsI/penicillin-binding protein 2
MKQRLLFLQIIIFLVALFWATYLFIVQVLDPFNLSYRRQVRYNPAKEIIIPVRGNIIDRNGELLASTIKFYQIDIDRNKVLIYCKKTKKNPMEVFDQISTIIANNSEEPKNKVYEKLSNRKSQTVMVSSSIKESELLKIEDELKKKRLNVLIPSFKSMQRIYSKGKLASRLLGLVREIQDETDARNRSVYRMEGFCGIEASFDDYLRGEYGWKETIYDANKSIVNYPNLQEKPAKEGYTVSLTIDSEIQQILEDNLWDGIYKYNAANAIGVIMNPKTGEILAMSGLSRSDATANESLIRASLNLPVTFRFEPGSTIKPFVSLLALDKKVFRPNDYIDCSTYNLGNRIIKDSHPLGSITFEDVIVKSSNVGIAKVAERIGSVDLYNRFITLGFGHKTGANIYGESSGSLRKYTDWSGFTLHSISFGQEISVNALQLTNAYCTLANGGKVLKPYILNEVIDKNNSIVYKGEQKVIRTISNEKNLNLEKQFLKNVVERGTATTAKISYVSVGGKTGTAEKKAAGASGYGKYTYTSVFSGFFPVENPQYVMTIIFDEPDYVYHFGSMSAVPTFKRVAEQIIALPTCKIIPELKQEKLIMVEMPNVMGMTLNKAHAVLNNKRIRHQFIQNEANGIVINQFPKADI